MSRKIFSIFLLFTLYAMSYTLYANKAYAWPQQKSENYEELVEKNLKLRGETASLSKKCKDLEKASKALINNIKKLEKENGSLDGGLIALKVELVKERSRSEKIEKEKVYLSEELRAAKNGLDKAKRKTEKSFAANHKGKERKLEKEVKKLRGEFKTLRVSSRAEIEKLKVEKKNLRKELRSDADEKKVIEKSLEEIGSQNKKLKEKYGLLKAENIKLREKAKLAGQLRKSAEKKKKLALKREKAARKVAERARKSASKQIKDYQDKFKKERIDARYNLAVVFDKNAMYKDAKREYLKVLKIDANDAGTHYNLAILYDDKFNQNRKAIIHYRKYLNLRPDAKDVEQVKEWILKAEQEVRIGIGVK